VSHRSQALSLIGKRVNFFVEPRHLCFWRIGAAQLIERLADGEFSCVSHCKILCRLAATAKRCDLAFSQGWLTGAQTGVLVSVGKTAAIHFNWPLTPDFDFWTWRNSCWHIVISPRYRLSN
jgi:hypothetical protein